MRPDEVCRFLISTCHDHHVSLFTAELSGVVYLSIPFLVLVEVNDAFITQTGLCLCLPPHLNSVKSLPV